MWFFDEKIMNSVFQMKLVGLGSKSNVLIDGLLNLVLNVGVIYVIIKDWFVGLLVLYLLLKIMVMIDSIMVIGVYVVSEVKIKINLVVIFLNVGYCF